MYQPVDSVEQVDIHEVCPGFSDFIGDVENNLKWDAEIWEKYSNNPEYRVLVCIDIINDFGKQDWAWEMTGEQWDAYVRGTARRYEGLK